MAFCGHGGGTVSVLARAILGVGPEIRYVATYLDGRLQVQQRDGLANASAAESDRYEELLVNPTLLTLLTQRGEIDCGGLRYVLVRYGNFFQLVAGVPGGHVSVALEATADLKVVERVRSVITEYAAGERGSCFEGTG